MAYFTIDDILGVMDQTALAQMTSEDGLNVDNDVVELGIAAVQGEMDPYIGKKYQLPLLTVPASITTNGVKMFKHWLYNRSSGRVGSVPDDVRSGYKDAIGFLKDVATGVVTLGIDPPPAAPTTGRAKATSNKRVFSNESMRGL